MKKFLVTFFVGLLLGLAAGAGGGIWGYRAWMKRFPGGNPFSKSVFDQIKEGDKADLPNFLPLHPRMKYLGKGFSNGKTKYLFWGDAPTEEVFNLYRGHFERIGWQPCEVNKQCWKKDRTICEVNVSGSKLAFSSDSPFSELTQVTVEVSEEMQSGQ